MTDSSAINALSDSHRFEDIPVKLDTCEQKGSYLVQGHGGSHIRLSTSAYRLLQAVNSGMSFDQIAEILNQRAGTGKVSPQQLQDAYQKLLSKLESCERLAAARRLPWGFWLRWRLIPERLVGVISSRLSIFYRPGPFILLLAIAATAAAWAVRAGVSLDLDSSGFLGGYFLFLASLFVHEFGHASACVRYGAVPSDIGFTVYLVYPAFYSNVSSAWRLNRWQRVTVDAGGNYFQLAWGCCYLVGFGFTHWEPLRVAFVMILYSVVFSLNPIFKFDGYWMLADLLGVVNLGQQPRRIAKYFGNRILRRPTEPLPWPAAVIAVLTLYTLATVWIWAGFLRGVLPAFWQAIPLLNSHWRSVRNHLAALEAPSWPESKAVLMSTLYLIMFSVMVWQIVKHLIGFIFRRLATLEESAPEQ